MRENLYPDPCTTRITHLELAVHCHPLPGMEGAQEAWLGLRVVLLRQLLPNGGIQGERSSVPVACPCNPAAP